MPTDATDATVYDNLDRMRGVEVFLDNVGAVSMYSVRKGLADAGAEGANRIALFEQLLDSQTLVVTAGHQEGNSMTSFDTPRTASGPNRRQLIAGTTGLAGALLVPGAASAQDASAANADFLFVQTADSMAFAADRNRLTLHDVGPTTLFFSDRPDRIAGTMTTESFVPFWSDGKDSFLSDPPNADISILENGTLRQTVAVLEDPVLENGELHYTVKIIDGDMPVLGENVSVFIDIIGMPLTPLSVAGVNRRAFRRAALY